jgi:plasmid stabilization system protein ParE
VARVQITTRALADLERLFDFLAEHNPKLARERIVSVRRAFDLLADHPLLGREAEDGRRELLLQNALRILGNARRWLEFGETLGSSATFPDGSCSRRYRDDLT